MSALPLILMATLPAQAPPAVQAPAQNPNQAFSEGLKAIPSHLQVEVPPTVDLVEEPSLPIFVTSAKPAAAAARSRTSGAAISDDTQSGRRQLVIALAPKEKVTLSLETLDIQKVSLQLGIPADPAHPLAAQLQKAKRLHPMIRAKGSVILNESDAPTEVVAVITGFEKNPYKLRIQRSR